MIGEDRVVSIQYRDPESERIAGDVSCVRAIAEQIERDRTRMITRVAATIVEHGQQANPYLLKMAARGLGIDPMTLAAEVAAVELRAGMSPPPLVGYWRRD